jgi:hypothetical protein
MEMKALSSHTVTIMIRTLRILQSCALIRKMGGGIFPHILGNLDPSQSHKPWKGFLVCFRKFFGLKCFNSNSLTV